MKYSPNLLYLEKLNKYKKFYYRLQKSIANGNFWKYSEAKRNTILNRLAQLKKRLEILNPQLNGILATGTVALMLTANSMSAQSFSLQATGISNPMNGVLGTNAGKNSVAPAFADLDNDGDLDIILADFNRFKYYKNTGSVTAAVYTEQTGVNNPLNGFTAGYNFTATLGDIDGDGDFDLLSGGVDSTGYIRDTMFYFVNTGSITSPAFTQQKGTATIPRYPHVHNNDLFSPNFVDIDNDGDLDVLYASAFFSNVYFLKNTGTATAPNLILTAGSNSPFTAINPIHGTYMGFPAFGDIDGDGDYDMVVGAYSSYSAITNEYYQNTGSSTTSIFTRETGLSSPFNGFTTSSKNGNYNASFIPSFADIDNDGDVDFFVGNGLSIDFYLNQSGNTTPPKPSISVAGSVLTSSSATGNQWYLNGVAIPGATSQNYTTTANGRYTVKVTINNFTSAASAQVVITGVVSTPATPTITPSGTVLTSSSATGNQWYLNGAIIAGATSQNYTATENGSYTVIVTNSGHSSAESAPVVITSFVNTPATPTISSSGTVLTSSSATGNQWYLNGVIIAGATSQNYTATENGSYTVIVTNSGHSSAQSTPVVITSFVTGITPYIIDNSLSIFPNPSNGNFSVTSPTIILSIEVISSKGEALFSQQINKYNTNVDLSILSSGIYDIKVLTAKGITSNKIIINH